MILPVPSPFSFNLSLAYLRRRAGELVDRVEGDRYRRLLITPRGPTLLQVEEAERGLQLSTPLGRGAQNDLLASHVRRILSLDTPLDGFYEVARPDPHLASLIRTFAGLRPVLTASPFEALVWAIVGQQITLQFAFTLKGRLVRRFGESIGLDGCCYWSFPTPQSLAAATVDELRAMQLSRSKADFIIGLARGVAAGEIDLGVLRNAPEEERIETLMQLRGVGRWTAEYASMRGYGARDALPAADVGLRNAVRNVYGLDHQPTEAEVRSLAERWRPWRSYAAFYLWATLWKT